MNKKSLPVINCIRKPGRTAALTVLSCILCFCILGGSLFITGLRSGLASLQDRLGADIMVVPYEASTKSSLKNIILQGNPGYFYMDKSLYDKIAAREGIEKITKQVFLATAAASCCSYKVQIVGFDPKTDFAILPWVDMSYKGELGYMEVFAGCDINALPGDMLYFYGAKVKVAARLDKTGTAYIDRAIFCDMDTIKTLIANAKERAIYGFSDVNPDSVVSSVLINVADDYSIEQVLNDINIHVKKVQAVKTETLISDVAEKLGEISNVAGALVIVIWVLVLVIMMLAFAMIANERKKEFAIYRVAGASRRKLSGILFSETMIVSLTGSTAGAAIAVLVSVLFSKAVGVRLGLPFLLPGFSGMILIVGLSIALSVGCGVLASTLSAAKISKVDTAFILRGEN